jgi:hypothetical protein
VCIPCSDCSWQPCVPRPWLIASRTLPPMNTVLCLKCPGHLGSQVWSRPHNHNVNNGQISGASWQPLGATFCVSLFDVQLALAKKPVRQMAIDFIHPLLKFPGRGVAVAGEQSGVLCLFEEPYRQGLRVFSTNRRSRSASIIAAAPSILRLSSLAFEADSAGIRDMEPRRNASHRLPQRCLGKCPPLGLRRLVLPRTSACRYWSRQFPRPNSAKLRQPRRPPGRSRRFLETGYVS